MTRTLAVLAFSLLAVLPLAAQERTFDHFAGNPGGGDSVDGIGADARLQPRSVMVDPSGVVYFSDATTVRVIATDRSVTTLAGLHEISAALDGVGSYARFKSPYGIARDSAGYLYVADRGSAAIRKISPSGIVTLLAGRPDAYAYYLTDGQGSAARFADPRGIAVDSAGSIYVVETSQNSIRKITSGGLVSTLVTRGGSADGTLAEAGFNQPSAIAVGPDDTLYIADEMNHTIRMITAGGVVSTLAGRAGVRGSSDGTGTEALFNRPAGIAVASDGTVYVADSFNHSIRKITAAGVVTTLAGSAAMPGSADALGAAAGFRFPTGVTLASTGELYVADSGNYSIRKVTAAGLVSTYAGVAEPSGSVDGTATEGRFAYPGGIAADSSGNFYVSDSLTNVIRKVTATGAISTVAGTAGLAGNADGTGADARFYSPGGLAVDSSGNLFIADTANHTIRKMTSAGVVTTFAGVAGYPGFADGLGDAARFNTPTDIAIDASNNLYVADLTNGSIRKITATGDVTTLANVDGAMSVAVDAAGTVYAGTATSGYYGDRIWKISSTGVKQSVNTCCGRVETPKGLAVTSDGSLIVADSFYRTVFSLSSTGVYQLLGGSGSAGSRDGTGLSARFSEPVAVEIVSNVIYVVDRLNHVIKAGRVAGQDASISFVPPVNTGTAETFSASLATTGWKWTLVRRPSYSTAQLSATAARTTQLTADVPGLYVLRLRADSASGPRYNEVQIEAKCAEPAPTVTTSLEGTTTICVGQTGGTVTAQAPAGVTVVAYQWLTRAYGSWSPIWGETGPTYSIKSSDFSSYYGNFEIAVKITTCQGEAISTPLAITLLSKPNADFTTAWTMRPMSVENASAYYSYGAQNVWSVTNGTILSGQYTSTLTYAAGSEGTTTVTLTASNGTCSTITTKQVTIVQQRASRLFLVNPCRMHDSRTGAPLASGETVTLNVGTCTAISPNATSIVANVTAVSPASNGWLTIRPADTVELPTSTINYKTGKTRANNAMLQPSPSGQIKVYNSGPEAVHFIIDVNGFFY